MPILQLFRNSTMFQTREAALASITEKASSLKDGEMWIASYGVNPYVKSILAVKRNYGITIFDSEAASDSIGSLNASDSAVAKKFVTSVSETNGIITVNRGEVTSTDKSVTLSDNADGGIDLSVNLDGDVFVKDQTDGTISINIDGTDNILSQDNGLKATVQLNKITTDLPTNVKERYQLVGKNNVQLGSTVIDIYKDSSLKEVYLGASTDTIDATTGVITKNTVTDPQSLNFAYQLADGTYSLVKIDVSKFLTESEFGDGLQVDGNGVVSVKVDSTSESFITNGSDGVKIDGINDAIDTKIAGVLDTLDATVGSTTVATDKHVAVQVVEEDGLLTSLTVTEDDIASATALNEIERVTSEALNDLEARKADKTDLEDLSTNALKQVIAGNGVNVSAKSNGQQTVSAKVDSVQTDNMLTVSSDGLYVSGIIDCGTYGS